MSRQLENTLRRLARLYYSNTDLNNLMVGSVDSKKSIIRRAVASGWLIRVRRGLYCVSDAIIQRKPHQFELAQLIYGISCISLESALSFHGLIPEAVYTTTSVTSLRNKTFRTPLGDFDYLKVPNKNFLIGVERVTQGNAVYFMATPWRALTDYVYCYKKDWTSLSPPEDDLRIPINDLPILHKEFSHDLISYYDSKRVTLFLMNVLKGGDHENRNDSRAS